MSSRICIIGLGYIGLPTAAIISNTHQHVLGVDIDEEVVRSINRGETHIIEPGLDTQVKKAISSGYFKATNEIEVCDIYIISVPTPFKDSNHEPDLSYIKSAVKQISSVLKPDDLIILESTSPVGTTEQLREWLAELREDLKFYQEGSMQPDIFIAYCPERVIPGNTLVELVQNDRVLGGLCEGSKLKAESFYKTFVTGECIKTDARTAEMTKLTENSFRDVNIALANELALISKQIDINVWELISLANRHPRVNILSPGSGVGGHCIAVDPWFIVDKNPDALLIKQARIVNDNRPIEIIEDVKTYYKSLNEDINIAIFGLSYKADIDDLRESPALQIADSLSAAFPNKVYAVEPNIEQKNISNEHSFNLIAAEEAFSIC